MKEKIKNLILLLLSHHSEEYYNRTFTLSFHGREIHFCARCSGVILSFLGAICCEFLINLKIEAILGLILASLLAVPVMIDWGTQKLGYRESKNSIRFGTGMLVGIGITFLRYTYEQQVLTSIVVGIFLMIFFIISMKGY